MHDSRQTAALLALLAALAVACGQDTPALTVPQALESGGDVLVEGYVFADPAGVRLCEAVAESDPPQCGGASLAVQGVEADDFTGLEREGDNYWSDRQQRVRGTVDGLTIDVSTVES